MESTSPISTRVDATTLNDLDRLAERYDRSRSWLVAQAVREYVDRETEFLDFIKAGEDDISKGNVISQAEMESWFENRIAEHSRNMSAKS